MRRIALLTAAVALSACGAHSQTSTPGGSAAFMTKTAKEPGVISLPDGLEYKIVKSGPASGAMPSSATR